MSVGSVLLGLALLLLVGLYISRPLLQSRTAHWRRPSSRQRLLAEKEAILAQIRDLDFDYDTGKVQESDYQQQRAQYMAEATAILKQLDEMEGKRESTVPATASPTANRTAEIDADIEAAVARFRQADASMVTEPAVSASTGSENGKSRFCPQCGEPTDPGDKFCAHCGHNLRLALHA